MESLLPLAEVGEVTIGMALFNAPTAGAWLLFGADL
jgi:hypothetical protein